MNINGLGLVLGILTILGVIALIVTCSLLPESVSIPPSENQLIPTQENVIPIPKLTFSPIVISGSDSETSPPFTVTTPEWIIDWSYVPSDPAYAIFGFFIYPRGETVNYAEAIAFAQTTNGSSYSYAGAGQYYVKVNAANIKSWKITIRPP